MKHHRFWDACGWVLAAGLIAVPVYAQSTGDAPAGAATGSANDAPVAQGDIVVTAQKRAETVNTVPLAVTAVGMGALRDANVTDVKGLATVVPGLQIQTVGIDSFVGVTIRGISNRSYSTSSNSAVSTYIDGGYVDLPVGFTESLYDLQRVEVLRGPQGTLYGRSATGGNINIVTADPVQHFDASADVSYGSYNDIQAHAMVNLPVSDTLAVRAAVMEHRSDGYWNDGGTTKRNYGAADDWGGRLTALWKPTSNFSWRLSLDQFVTEGTPGGSVQTGINASPVNGLSPYHQPVSSDPEPDNHIASTSIRSRMEWHPLDHLTLSYVASWQRINAYYDWATSGQLGAPANTGWQQHAGYRSYAQFHEVDAAYDSGRFKNVVGASYFNENITDTGSWGIYRAINYIYRNVPDQSVTHKRSWGVFDQASYALLDNLKITGGIRYSHDEQSQGNNTTYSCPGTLLPNETLAQSAGLQPGMAGCYSTSYTPYAKGSWSKVTWKAGLDYQVAPGTLAYASVTTGYKPGGVQPGMPVGIPDTYKPEDVTNYEVGLKTRLLDNKLTLRAAGFYEDYTNLQVFQLTASAAGVKLATLNAAKAKIYGVELEGTYEPTRNDHFSGFATWLHATYASYPNAIDSRTSLSVGDISGDSLPQAPRFQMRAQYSHDFHLAGGGMITPLAGINYQTKSYTMPENISWYKINAYTKTDASITYTDKTGRWKLSVYGDNLENKAVITGNWASSGGVYSDYAPPRTFGVRASWQY